jgi:hypothetical protein
MLEVEQAAMDSEATARLSQIRSQLGLESAPAETSMPSAAPQEQVEGGSPA